MNTAVEYMPAMVVFLRDVLDDSGATIGWQPVAWGIVVQHANGPCITLSNEEPPAARLWPDLNAAEDSLGALSAREHPHHHQQISP